MEETRTSYARLPLPFVGLMAMVGAALHVISCSSYVRPSELLTLQARELEPPQTSVDARLQHWGLLLCPTERDVRSKLLAFDESVMLNSPWMTWAAPWINALHQQPQNHSTWPFDQLAHTEIHSIAARANVAFLGVAFTAPRRSVARCPDGTQKLGSDKSTRKALTRLLSTTLQQGNTGSPTNRHARPRDGGIRTVPTPLARPTLVPTSSNVGVSRPRANNV